MARVKPRTALIGTGLGALGMAGAAFAAQRSLGRAIAADPTSARLREPARGEPVTVRSVDGTEIHVERFGEPDGGPVLVLIHGWTETIGYWTPVIETLRAEGVAIVAYDLRGHGDSARASSDYAIPRFGEDLEAVLAECVPAGGAVLAGHSLGAMSIASWAESFDVPARAAAAALMNTGVGGLIAESLLVPLPAFAHALRGPIALRGFLGSRAPLPRYSTPISHAILRYAAFGPKASPAKIAFYERMLLATPPDVRADVGIAMSEMDLYGALANLTVPTAVVAGARDRLTPPSHGRRIAEMLPELHSHTVLDGVGHMSPVEAPREIAAKLVELIALARERTGATL
ncbi:MAG TPA: alpha/beta hydrolase [Solirubrobacteraceae bacterium]|nr:alpha/beta hydrolase [Solirubrobacteraceae bacterium]